MARIEMPARAVPAHLILDDYIADDDVGVIKGGKEADVHLVRREARDGRSCLLAAKRYREPEHRAFRNDAAYRAHRRIDGLARDRGGAKVRRKGGRNLQKAMDQRSTFGRAALHEQWIGTEFAMLETLWRAGAPVPYPVSRLPDGVLMEYVGDEEAAAPRLVHARVDRAELPGLFGQLRAALLAFARAGIVHGDLSPYNLLLWEGRLWVIDLPQAVPYLANDDATDFLHRDVVNACAWFVRKGLEVDPEDVFVEVVNVLFDHAMEDLFHAHR